MTTPCTKEREIGEIAATVRLIHEDVIDVKDAVKNLIPDVVSSKIQHTMYDKVGRSIFAVILIFLSAAVSFVVAAAAKN